MLIRLLIGSPVSGSTFCLLPEIKCPIVLAKLENSVVTIGSSTVKFLVSVFFFTFKRRFTAYLLEALDINSVMPSPAEDFVSVKISGIST